MAVSAGQTVEISQPSSRPVSPLSTEANVRGAWGSEERVSPQTGCNVVPDKHCAAQSPAQASVCGPADTLLAGLPTQGWLHTWHEPLAALRLSRGGSGGGGATCYEMHFTFWVRFLYAGSEQWHLENRFSEKAVLKVLPIRASATHMALN